MRRYGQQLSKNVCNFIVSVNILQLFDYADFYTFVNVVDTHDYMHAIIINMT